MACPNRLYEKWGIGKKGVDEGALLVVALSPRVVRIEVGYGAEGYLTDAQTRPIREQRGNPHFRQGNYGAGLLAMSLAIAGEVQKEKGIELAVRPPNRTVTYHRPRRRGGGGSVFQAILIIIVVGFLLATPFGRAILWGLLLSSLIGGRRGGFGGGGFGGGFGGGGFGGGFGGGLSGGAGSSGSY